MKNFVADFVGLDRVAKLYLLSQFCQSLYFTWPIWYGFASGALSPLQIGIYFSVLAGVKLLAEVPTGAFADKFGRKLSAMIGAAMQIFVPLIWYFGHTFEAYVIAAIISGIGWAFTSGSLEALLYDHKNIPRETFRKVAWFEITTYQTGLILSAVSGGLFFSLHPQIPFFLEAVAAIAAFMAISAMHEEDTSVRLPEEKAASYASYFKDGLRFLLASTYLKVLVAVGVVAEVVVHIGINFLNEATMIHYSIEPWARGLLIGGTKVLALIAINILIWRFIKSDRLKLMFVATMGVTIFSFLSIDFIGMFLVGFALFSWISATQSTIVRNIMHDHLPSSHRATALSGFSALCGIGALVGSTGIGALIQSAGQHAAYQLELALFICIVVPCVWWLVKHPAAQTQD